MTILQIEHPVKDYEEWKKTFDSDPLDRKKSGVKSYRIYRAVGDSNQVIVDLAFENPDHAVATLQRLHNLWNAVTGSIVIDKPTARLLDFVESKVL
jgi:hypothetical protein